MLKCDWPCITTQFVLCRLLHLRDINRRLRIARPVHALLDRIGLDLLTRSQVLVLFPERVAEDCRHVVVVYIRIVYVVH